VLAAAIAFTLPTGTASQPYSFNLSTIPNAFTNTQFTTQGVNNFGTLPPGLSFVNGTSTIFGTPTAAGTYASAFVVRGIQIAFQYVLSFRFLPASSSTDGGSSIVVPPPGSAGTVVLASDLSSGTVFTGGTLLTANGLTSSASFVLGAGGATVVTPPSGTATLSGVISGSGGMTVVSGASTSSSTCLSCSGGILSGAAVVATSSGTVSYQTSAGQTLNLPSLSGGNLVLSGNNTYSGGTTVASGTLQVNGVSPTGSGDVTINSGGMLMGTGTISGGLTVSGILKPGNSPGYLAVGTNVSLASGSLYVQDIAGLAQSSSTSPSGATGYYAYLSSTAGQFVINPSVLLAPRLANLFSAGEPGYGSSIFVPELGNRFRMVTASGGVAGRFAAVIQPAQLSSGTQFIAFYNVNNSNSIDLATVPTSYVNTLDAEKGNAKSVARVLDQLLGVNQVNTATAAQDQLLYAASGQAAASLPAFVKVPLG
jgi:autotransporter-associated beta strand protein